jgi:hypothetical protein
MALTAQVNLMSAPEQAHALRQKLAAILFVSISASKRRSTKDSAVSLHNVLIKLCGTLQEARSGARSPVTQWMLHSKMEK